MIRRLSLALATIAALSLATACTSPTSPAASHDCGGTQVGSGGC
jgi:hypothetical protein